MLHDVRYGNGCRPRYARLAVDQDAGPTVPRLLWNIKTPSWIWLPWIEGHFLVHSFGVQCCVRYSYTCIILIGVTLERGARGRMPLECFLYLRTVFLATELKRGKWKRWGKIGGKGYMYTKGWLKPISPLVSWLLRNLEFLITYGQSPPNDISQATPTITIS